LIENYSSVEFLKNGKYIAARDYLSVKVWDLANTKKPLMNVSLQETMKTKLCEVFENDCIFDKFKLTSSNDGNTLLTGTYNNCFHVIDTVDGSNTQFELNYKKTTLARNIIPEKPPALTKMDYIRKTNACDFNKKKNSLAVASLNCFFIYSM
jgi:serine/threonine-protein phosphatase 2A regulatory subunit B